MTKGLYRVLGSIMVFCLISGVAIAAEGEGKKKTRNRTNERFEISAKPWGPTQVDVDSAKSRLEKSSVIRSSIGDAKHRMIDFEIVERTDSNKNSLVPTHFRAFYYDYTHGKTFIAEGDFAGRESIRVSETLDEPNVSATQEEIEAGYELAKMDPKLGNLFRAGKIEFFAPMPPLLYKDGERLVNIGVRYLERGNDEIAGVSFKNERVVFYDLNAEPNAGVTTGGNCGFPSSGGSSSSGTGMLQVTLQVEGQTLWEMLVVRPAMSSGRSGEGSGIEVRDVKYKGKSVLKRGHAPILNVKYHPGGCNGFRDWQDTEGPFNAPSAGAQDPIPGYRILADGQVATTIVETGTDVGNFQGVAIYQQDDGPGIGNQLVLVTEMNAGWYRYIMEWRFGNDGTIRPRYGFGSTTSSCVCRNRDHHVYWRFDFDVVNANNDIYQVERGRRFLTPIKSESKIFRNYQTNRSILIQNSSGDEAYQLTPNITDEEAIFSFPTAPTVGTYGRGDLWVLRFKGTTSSPSELDDPTYSMPAACGGTDEHPTRTDCWRSYVANIDPWVDGEAIGNNDAVVWYAGHQFRNDATSLTNHDRSGLTIGGVHTIGPDLRPVRW